MKTTILLLLISTLSIGQSYNWDSIAIETQKKLDRNESINLIMKTIEIKTDLSGEELQVLIWELEAFCEGKRLPKPVLRQADVSGALPFDKVTRLEVISYREGDKSGRVFTHWKDDNKIEGQLQDKDRTLKIFIDKR